MLCCYEFALLTVTCRKKKKGQKMCKPLHLSGAVLPGHNFNNLCNLKGKILSPVEFILKMFP